MIYIAQVGLTNDATGRNFAAGDTVTDDDFNPEVIANWLAAGVLVKDTSAVTPESSVTARAKVKRGDQ